MEKRSYSVKFLRKRKLMVMLPLIALPFLTMAFWSLGGGGGTSVVVTKKEGLNATLPAGKMKQENVFDKLSFYRQAETDSAKLKEILKTDPYYRSELTSFDSRQGNGGLNGSPYEDGGNTNVKRVYEKLDELNRQISTPAIENGSLQKNRDARTDTGDPVMQTSAKDPEMDQINSMLDKIMDVQHPERVKERSLKNKNGVYSVSRKQTELTETIITKDSIRPIANGFYSDAGKPLSDWTQSSGITAVVHETQTVVTGATIKLRLTSDVYINGNLVPAGTFVFGIASLENDRLTITISAINFRNNLLPVSLSVFDVDGVAGIYVPGSVNRDVAKQSASQGLSGVELISMDPSLQAQAATAGIGAAKTLLAKKVKLVKVTVKAGYKVLLKDNNQQNY